MVSSLLKRVVAIGIFVLVAEVAYAVLKPSPVLDDFDPSGDFGDPKLPKLRVAVLGDSSVTAPGVHNTDQIWVSIVCNRLARDRHVILRSFAIGGSRAEDVLAEQVDDAIAFEPDLILLSVGANDTLKGVGRRTFARNLDVVVGRLAASGATVVQSGVGVMGTIPRLYPPLSTLMTARSARFDRIHHQVAQRHGTAVVDQRNDHPELWRRDMSLWAADYFHVSPAGHARWAERAWLTLEPLMGNE